MPVLSASALFFHTQQDEMLSIYPAPRRTAGGKMYCKNRENMISSGLKTGKGLPGYFLQNPGGRSHI